MLSEIPQARKTAPAAAQAAGVEIDRLLGEALALENEGKPEAAVLAFTRALSIDGRHLDALCGLGELLLRLETVEEALVCFDKALTLDSRYVPAIYHRGLAFAHRGDDAAAVECFQRVLELMPGHLGTICHLGKSFGRLERYEDALRCFDLALTSEPNDPSTLVYRGTALAALGRMDQALESFNRSLAIRPDHADTLLSRSVALLASGRLLEGFREYECRWQTHLFRRPSSHLWLGDESLAGKTILLPAEQGIGDTLQFVRFAPWVADRAARVMLVVPTSLRGLLDSVDPRIEVMDADAEVPAHDYYCPIVSLATAFRCTLETIPTRIPYLTAKPDAIARWRTRLGEPRRPRIGLVWNGLQQPRTPLRDVPLQMLTPLFDLDADFISLQKEVADSEWPLLARVPLARYGEALVDFNDTAALIAHLDLVISVDTAVAHLAGALGKPVFILNRFAPCWRWLRDRDDSPWYPTARLFRQTTPGDWSEVVRRVHQAAAAFIARDQAVEPERVVPRAVDELNTLQTEAYSLIAQGDYAQAQGRLDRLLAQRPDDVDLLNDRGSVAGLLGQNAEALAFFERALARDPSRVNTLFNYGLALGLVDRHEEAVASLRQAIAARADQADALNALAFSLRSLGRLDEALACLDRALAIDPAHAGALANRGLTLTALYRGPEAMACFERVGKLDAHARHLDAFVTAAGGCFELARYEDAEALLKKSLRVRPGHPEALLNRGAVRLIQGDLPAGFRDSEARWRTAKLRAVQFGTNTPQWSGFEPLESKTIVLFHDQGFGDSLQFVRYAPLLCARGARVILRVPEALRALMQSLRAQAPGTLQVIGDNEALPPHDFHCPMMSLPLAFGTDLATIPAAVPYLAAEAAAVERWRGRLGPKRRARIGILWRGRLYPPLNTARDIPLGDLTPLFSLPADFISMQKEYSDADRAALQNLPVLRHGEELADFADAAALIENLDLVIAVDTAIAHLAGAMGKPVWLMNRYASCWRWLREREDSPWYPTLRLFRQQSLGDWPGVVATVRHALQAYLQGSRPPLNEMSAAPAATGTPGSALAEALAAERAGDEAAAIQGFTGVLQRDPRNVVALCGLGRVMLAIDSYDEALVCLDKALLIDPQHIESQYRSGIALDFLGRKPEAIERFERVLGLDPGHPEALFRRSAALADLARFEEALTGLDRLVELWPNDIAVLDARAFALAGLGRLEDALASYDRVLAINPQHPGARRRRSWIHLAQGRLLEGFRDHEYRWPELQTYANKERLTHLITLPLATPAPLWLGDAPLSGKTLLLHHEQGLGDTLQFVRYAPLAAALGARVILGVPPSLRRLLEAMPAVADVTIRTDALPAHDFHCPMMSLPLAFRTTLDSIPANTPYLKADPQDQAVWAQRLGPATRPRIGLVWGCGAYPPGRAIPLDLLRPLLDLDADFISLQKELGEGDSVRLAEFGIAHHGELLDDFADTAALIANLDLLISVDTSTAHLAGALGKPVWVLLKFPADWRWLLGRDDSPWYPSARLFRQESAGDWSGVVRKLRQAAQTFLADLKTGSAVARKTVARRRASMPAAVDADIRRGTALLNAGDAVGSLACFSSALQRAPDHPLALSNGGVALANLGRYAEALDHFARVPQSDPTYADAQCNSAFVLRQIGRDAEARDCAERALQSNPRHAGALSNQSLAFSALGRHAEALEAAERALALNPDDEDCLGRLGFVLTAMGRHEEALAALDRLLTRRPDLPQALVSRGHALLGLKRYPDALQSFDRVSAVDPSNVSALCGRGVALIGLKRNREALSSLERAAVAAPDELEIHHNRAVALNNLCRHQEALQSTELALRRRPAYLPALIQQATALMRLQRFDQAADIIDQALSVDPENSETRCVQGQLLLERKCDVQALERLQGVLARQPDNLTALTFAGTAWMKLQNPDQALWHMDRALALEPGNPAIWTNKAAVLYGLGRRADALELLQAAVAANPENDSARYNRSLALLALGCLDEGFRDFEHRWRVAIPEDLHLKTPAPLWLGAEPLTGKTLLVHCEQGLGDALQFVRYVPRLAEAAERVQLLVPPALGALMQTLPGVASGRVHLFTDRHHLPPHDVHCPIMSVALAVGTTLDTVPTEIPYLSADAARVALWRARLGDKKRPRIGIAWSGQRANPQAGRDIPLALLQPLAALDVDLISLQKEVLESDRGTLEGFAAIARFGESLADFADTAALIETLDLVIAVDTAVAHLAGALGKPVWVLLKSAADWRWLEQREDSPWYPSARLFRQSNLGDWASLIDQVRRALEATFAGVRADIDRAIALHQRGRSDAALQCVDQVLERKPDDADALLVRAVTLAKAGRHADALVTTERLLAIVPDLVEALSIRGHALRALDRPREALACFDRALGLDPERVNALALRSFAYAELGRFDEALASMDRALALAPSNADTLELKASLLQRLGRRREALQWQDRVIAAEPGRAMARKNRALLKLSLGQLAEGFRELEERWNTVEFEPDRLDTRAPRWNGEPITGKTILLHHEQGFGDSLQFARYVPRVAALGAQVILRVPAGLARLLQSLGPIRVIAQPEPGVAPSEPLPPHDFYCSLMSLPAAFGTTLESIPAQVPYLHAHPERAAYWGAKLGPKTRPRIGLVWAGRRVPPIVERRDIPLALLRPLLDLDADFISLQRELAPADREALQDLPVRLLGEALEDFADTGALVENLDLVISVDSAVLHLAGALGKPVWLMNRFAPCWRWLEDRSDSPWYPTLRLFGQTVSGDWAGVVDQVTAAAGPFLQACRAAEAGAASDRPVDVDALMGRGIFHFEQGELSAALDYFEQAQRQAPADCGALINRASVLARLGRFDEALACFEQVPPDHPGYTIALLNRANALRHLARHAESLELLERLLRLRPDDVQVLHDLGLTLARLWRFEEALVHLDRAIAVNPGYPTAYVMRAFVLDALERDAEAAADLERALALAPEQPEALNNYGNALLKLSRAGEALAVFQHALRLQPWDFGAAHNCWTAVDKLGQHAQALQLCEQFLTRHPGHAAARLDRAMCLLSDGRLREGFAEFEARWETSPYQEARLGTGAPLWLGQAPLRDKTILLHREQGLGDAIQFVRYVPLVAAQGARILLRVPATLTGLMQSLDCSREAVQLIVEGEPLPAHDYHCPLMSLPLAFDTAIETVPAQVPYLHADPTRVSLWAARLGRSRRLRVGLAWSGRFTPPVIPRRDIPLKMLAPWFELDADFVSLQKEMRPTDRQSLAMLPLARHGEALEDFDDTAALIANLDLVICVDTSVAHVAGALGKPVWILSRHDGCWRWMRERSDSPWYPTARLFRQSTLGDWAPVVEQVRHELRELIGTKRAV